MQITQLPLERFRTQITLRDGNLFKYIHILYHFIYRKIILLYRIKYISRILYISQEKNYLIFFLVSVAASYKSIANQSLFYSSYKDLKYLKN